MIAEFEKFFSVNIIGAFHLNDSLHGLGSRKDRHCSFGKGFLGLEVFHAIINDKRFKKFPKIIENPERDKESKRDLDLLRNIHRKPKEDIVSLYSKKICGEQESLFKSIHSIS